MCMWWVTGWPCSCSVRSLGRTRQMAQSTQSTSQQLAGLIGGLAALAKECSNAALEQILALCPLTPSPAPPTGSRAGAGPVVDFSVGRSSQPPLSQEWLADEERRGWEKNNVMRELLCGSSPRPRCSHPPPPPSPARADRSVCSPIASDDSGGAAMMV